MKKARRAKIICTIGPASSSPETIASLIRAGMDVARLNFSHGDHASHGRVIGLVREAARKAGKPVALLQDLQGIKIRVGLMRDGEVELKTGSTVRVFPGAGTGDADGIYITYPLLLRDARPGDRILIDDGLIQMRVVRREKTCLTARVLEGGLLRDRKGVNLPGMRISTRSFTAKDRKDLAFGLRNGVDYVAISFVRTAAEVRAVKNAVKRKGADVPVIAKIEKPEALANIDEILAVSEGIMIARGDMGVELSPEEVPLVQKDLILRANTQGKLVITATQMLESMTGHRRPTRAEAADVANAVIDGTDALMLSAETATGSHPVDAVRMMDRIVAYTEQKQGAVSSYIEASSYADALADGANQAAKDLNAEVFVAYTHSGFTARLASKFRPEMPIIAFTPDRAVMHRMSLFWGVVPRYIKPSQSIWQLMREVERSLLRERLAKKGDKAVVIAASPLSTRGKTNFMKLIEIGE